MNQKKVARICWNVNNWQFPSGKLGKTKSKKAYESLTGYGHEEWLFDTTKLINGFHYAYIQAIGQNRDKYRDDTFDISFYTINSSKNERWWLGEIFNIAVVGEEESEVVFQDYKKNGWLREMHDQLIAVGASINDFKSITKKGFCCIKFRPKDMAILEEPFIFGFEDPAVKSDYYNLKNSLGTPTGLNIQKGFIFTPSGSTVQKKTASSRYHSQTKDIDLIHNQIQDDIFEMFCKDRGVENVSLEQDTGFGTKIDIAIRSCKGYWFYELKTGNSAKQCIREALSQLIEYSYYPNYNLAEKLIIVSPAKLTGDSKQYLKTLRNTLEIPVYYQEYSLETKSLSKEY